MSRAKAGDRIRLENMPDDPNPIQRGTMGIVTSVNAVTMMGPPFTQYSVKWDNGRSLMLCVPPDSFTVVERAEA